MLLRLNNLSDLFLQSSETCVAVQLKSLPQEICKRFLTMADANSNKIICHKCQTENPPERKTCLKCKVVLRKPGAPSPKRTGGSAKFTGILSQYSGRKAHGNRSSTTGRLTTSTLGNLPRELLGPQLTLPPTTTDFAPLVQKNAKYTEYPYDRRVCQNCDEKIETQDAQGKCSSCGTPFRYAPLLRPGQYKVPHVNHSHFGMSTFYLIKSL